MGNTTGTWDMRCGHRGMWGHRYMEDRGCGARDMGMWGLGDMGTCDMGHGGHGGTQGHGGTLGHGDLKGRGEIEGHGGGPWGWLFGSLSAKGSFEGSLGTRKVLGECFGGAPALLTPPAPQIVLVDDLEAPVPEGGSHEGLPTPVNLELEWVLGKMPRKVSGGGRRSLEGGPGVVTPGAGTQGTPLGGWGTPSRNGDAPSSWEWRHPTEVGDHHDDGNPQ